MNRKMPAARSLRGEKGYAIMLLIGSGAKEESGVKKRGACLLAAMVLLLSSVFLLPRRAAAESWDQVIIALASEAPDPVPAAWRLTADEGWPAAWTERDPAVRNILLLSTDAPDLSDNRGRTGFMMLCSVHTGTGETRLIALPEEMPVAVDGLPEEIRLKYVNCFGGPLLTMQTVSEQMQVYVNRYCSVNEAALIRAVDLMGGARLALTDSEREALALAPEAALLSGEQAMRYLRLRRAGEDWERPWRLLEALADQAFEGGIDGAFAHMERLLPAIGTNLTTSDVVDLLFAVLGQESPPVITARSMDAADAAEAAQWLRQALDSGL